MKSPLGILMLGVLCAIGGGVCWRLGRLEQDIASTGTLLLTLRYDTAGLNAAKASAVLAAGSSLEAARQFRATADYWSQQYSKLTGPKTSNEDSEQRDVEELEHHTDEPPHRRDGMDVRTSRHARPTTRGGPSRARYVAR